MRSYDQSPLINPRMLRRLKHFNSRITIAIPEIIQDEYNQETTIYKPIEQLSNIRGYKEPKTLGNGETRLSYATFVQDEFTIMLAGYYPAIDVEMIAIIDGIPYNITDVAHDDSKTFTVLNIDRTDQQSDQEYNP